METQSGAASSTALPSAALEGLRAADRGALGYQVVLALLLGCLGAVSTGMVLGGWLFVGQSPWSGQGLSAVSALLLFALVRPAWKRQLERGALDREIQADARERVDRWVFRSRWTALGLLAVGSLGLSFGLALRLWLEGQASPLPVIAIAAGCGFLLLMGIRFVRQALLAGSLEPLLTAAGQQTLERRLDHAWIFAALILVLGVVALGSAIYLREQDGMESVRQLGMWVSFLEVPLSIHMLIRALRQAR